MSTHDDRLVEQLRALAQQVDPPPALVTEFARAALGWRDVDAELAELAYDSAADTALEDAVRGTGYAPRLLTFDAEGITVEVEVAERDGQRRVVGQVVPMQPVVIELRHGGGTTVAEIDELGRFAAEGLQAGPVSLRCRLQDGRIVHTDWAAI